MYRCHPRWQTVRQLVNDGAIGDLGTVHTIFSYDNRNAADIRNIGRIGRRRVARHRLLWRLRGAATCLVREPMSVAGTMEIDPVFGTDRLTSAVLDFGRGTRDRDLRHATRATPVREHPRFHRTDRAANCRSIRRPTCQPASGSIVTARCRDHRRAVRPISWRRSMASPQRSCMVRRPPVSLVDSLANMVALDNGNALATIGRRSRSDAHLHSWSRRFRGFGYRQRPSTQYHPPRACAQWPASQRR